MRQEDVKESEKGRRKLITGPPKRNLAVLAFCAGGIVNLFEFHYAVALSITHPTLSATKISEMLPGLCCDIKKSAGEPRGTRRDGSLIPGVVPLSLWSVRLHEGRIYSGDLEMDEFLRKQLGDLKQYQSALQSLSQNGDVHLWIEWYSETTHSAARMSHDVVRMCAELSLHVELNMACPHLGLPRFVTADFLEAHFLGDERVRKLLSGEL